MCGAQVSMTASACAAYNSCYASCQCSDTNCLAGCLSKVDSTCANGGGTSFIMCEANNCSTPCGATGGGNEGGVTD
jgi:hypothetical protein